LRSAPTRFFVGTDEIVHLEHLLVFCRSSLLRDFSCIFFSPFCRGNVVPLVASQYVSPYLLSLHVAGHLPPHRVLQALFVPSFELFFPSSSLRLRKAFSSSVFETRTLFLLLVFAVAPSELPSPSPHGSVAIELPSPLCLCICWRVPFFWSFPPTERCRALFFLLPTSVAVHLFPSVTHSICLPIQRLRPFFLAFLSFVFAVYRSFRRVCEISALSPSATWSALVSAALGSLYFSFAISAHSPC